MGNKESTNKEVPQPGDSGNRKEGTTPARSTTQQELAALRQAMMRHLGGYRGSDVSSSGHQIPRPQERTTSSGDTIEEIGPLPRPEEPSLHKPPYNESEVREIDSKTAAFFDKEKEKGKPGEKTKTRRENRRNAAETFCKYEKDFTTLMRNNLQESQNIGSLSEDFLDNWNRSTQNYLYIMLQEQFNMHKTVIYKEAYSFAERKTKGPKKSDSYTHFKYMKQICELCEDMGKKLRESQLRVKYGTGNITELYKKATDPSSEEQIKEIKICNIFTYITDKGTLIKGNHWKHAHAIRDQKGKDGKEAVIAGRGVERSKHIFSPEYIYEQQREQVKGWNAEKSRKLTDFSVTSLFYNCFTKTFVGREGGWLTMDHVKTILREHDYYPIAGWSLNGNHPNREHGGEGFFPITRSDNDPITIPKQRSGESPQPQKGDVGVCWVQNTVTKQWFPSHTFEISRVEGPGADNIFGKSKMGHFGEYEHPASGISAYGDAWTIYHSDNRDNPRLKKSEQKEDDPLRPLRENDFHVIARSGSDGELDPTSLDPATKGRPQEGDMIVYWLENPYIHEWSPVDIGRVSCIKDDKIFVEIAVIKGESNPKKEKLKLSRPYSDFNTTSIRTESSEHLASDLAFAYTRWEICRLGNPASSTDPAGGS